MTPPGKISVQAHGGQPSVWVLASFPSVKPLYVDFPGQMHNSQSFPLH
jgi:hypothetical protein